ncbi:MAG: hypothetical protein M3162_08135 [Thermoproteota archaeon]|nr:hypothetical protein [Thermoproteota archaeon]
MAQFFFKPDSIDRVEFNPIPISIDKGIIKFEDSSIYHDTQENNSQIPLGNAQEEDIIKSLQGSFYNQYQQYGKVKIEDINPQDQETMQASSRLQRFIANMSIEEGKGEFT